jgi:integrase
MTWEEIDLDANLRCVPANRMKTRRQHFAPLAPEMLALLPRTNDRNGIVFVMKTGRPYGAKAMRPHLRKFDSEDRATVHGFRSTFRT